MIDPQRIWSSPQLPTLPDVAAKLLALSKNPQTETKDVVEAIMLDRAIAAKILRSTNSSYFGLRSEITSIERAVPILGTTVASSLALGFSLADSSTNAGPLSDWFSSYWLRSVVQGVTAELLGENMDHGLECDYFLAGLLTDLGHLAMLKVLGEEYVPVLQAADDEHRELCVVEQDRLGFDHVEIGTQLMRNWQLPEILISSAELHHTSLERIAEQKSEPHFDLIAAVAAASAVGDYFCSQNNGLALSRLQALSTEFLAFHESDVEEFLRNAQTRIDEAGEMLSADTDELGDPNDLHTEAKEQLAQFHLREHAVGSPDASHASFPQHDQRTLEASTLIPPSHALHDPLTKIYNRTFFDEALKNELNRCSRDAKTVGIVFCDIDQFKRLNDTFGRQFGDHVLERVASACGKVIRKTDVLARYGGEEFVLLAIHPTENGLDKICERIRACVESEEIFSETIRVPVTVSLGAAFAIPSRDNEGLAERLITAAGEATLDSKRNGRNQVHVRSLLSDMQKRLRQMVNERRFSRWLVDREILDIPAVSRALSEHRAEHVRIGESACQLGLLTEEQVDEIVSRQTGSNDRFGEIAVQMKFLSEENLAMLLALQQEDPAVLADALVRLNLLDRNTANNFATEYRNLVMPIGMHGHTVPTQAS